MASIGFVIDQIKKNPAQLLDHLPVREVCLQLGLNFRDRCLDPVCRGSASWYSAVQRAGVL